jgi:hypothetical protein
MQSGAEVRIRLTIITAHCACQIFLELFRRIVFLAFLAESV